MRLLVTGGSGFIGTNLVQHALDHGVEVLNL
ncbi:MAG: NAD-dependent epimerase/dehydratase family protein, partial [Flavobacteriales bacterium]|nr:NAD-dependent epimerase/dehydratase family protein [Flavobacteriales bacterium]